MGISGLLPLLKSIHKPCNLKKFSGQTLGVDAYGWLHRGTVACAMELALDKPTRKFVDFAMHRVRMLQHFGVTPFLVFDGDYLPSKAATEADRAKKREASKSLGLELLSAGKVSQAYLELQKAIDVSPEMARQLIDELKKTGVQYIVAPYEADAQMVYLERKGIITGIISEDSDLLVFGAKCLLTKLDQYGNCVEINKADFCACREISLTGWSDTEFRRMAILSGCDYLPSINNMGLKTAYRMVRKHKTIEKILRMVQFDGKYHVPKDYLEAFYQAEFTFLHQRVYCPQADALVFHTQPDQVIDEEKMHYIGAHVEPEIARGVATGDLNPMTKQPILSVPSSSVNTSRAPWVATRPNLRRAATSDDFKKKPMETFFKPKRIPLAELDPNCFTPSPSQHDAVSRNSGPWTADSVDRPYLHRSSTGPEPQLPRLSSSSTENHTGRTHSRNTTISEPRPPKRPRLCAENPDNTPLVNGLESLGRSRFFKSSVLEPSPSFGRSTKSKRSKQDEINIYSDDSIEEALLTLPDLDGFKSVAPKQGKKITIFDEEEVRVLNCATAVLNDSQSTTITNGSQSTMPNLTQSTSIASSSDDHPTPDFTAVISVTASLSEKFSFTPSPKQHLSTLRTPGYNLALPTPPSSCVGSMKPSRIPLAVKSPPSTKSTPICRVQTPLQSLGVKALSRSFALPTPSSGTTLKVEGVAGLAKSQSGGVPFPEVARVRNSLLKNVLDPANIPLPPSTKDEDALLTMEVREEPDQNQALGSEDFIVHDSEEELDDNSNPRSLEKNAVKLDLGRFAFKG